MSNHFDSILSIVRCAAEADVSTSRALGQYHEGGEPHAAMIRAAVGAGAELQKFVDETALALTADPRFLELLVSVTNYFTDLERKLLVPRGQMLIIGSAPDLLGFDVVCAKIANTQRQQTEQSLRELTLPNRWGGDVEKLIPQKSNGAKQKRPEIPRSKYSKRGRWS